mgnify:CR=1 FL=1
MESPYAFISYSRKDFDVADWLHNKLEHYRYPRESVHFTCQPPNDKYISPVFIDVKDLHSKDRPFTDEIQKALNESKYLILICSRNSAKSSFVDYEVRYFLKCHKNDTSRIVPFFIDEVDNDTIPAVVYESDIMKRHFPIFHTALGKKSEANEYCFYQLVSYMLKLEFSVVYDRFEAYKSKQRKRKTTSLIYVILTLLISTFALWMQYRAQKRLTEFEKKVFPAAIVYGYEENFLTPVINYLKSNTKEDFSIYVLMPGNRDDLKHKKRIIDLKHDISRNLDVDSVCAVRLNTEKERGSNVFRLYRNGLEIPNVYIDFAETTTAFIRVADYKRKGSSAYQQMSDDEIISEYAQSFTRQTMDLLKGDSAYVKVFTDKQEMIESIRKMICP